MKMNSNDHNRQGHMNTRSLVKESFNDLTKLNKRFHNI